MALTGSWLDRPSSVFSHVRVTCFYPNSAMRDAVHDGISMHITTEPYMPVLLPRDYGARQKELPTRWCSS